MFIWKTNNACTIRLFKIGVTNCYFIEHKSFRILVDTGQKRGYNKLRALLKYYINNEYRLNYIILTHTHYDHAGNVASIKNEFGAKLIAHKNESGYLENGFTKLPKGTSFATKIISNLGNLFAKRIARYNPVKADITIEDEYFIEDIPEIRIIHTPGHSIGSLSILIDKEIAFVGDTFFGVFPKSIYPPFADNKKELLKSWEKLKNTSCKLFLPGHGKAIAKDLIINELNRH